MTPSTAALVREYAAFHIDARRLAALGDHLSSRLARALEDRARLLFAQAPSEALPDLDTVKRILEIDPTTTDLSLVMSRINLTVHQA
jgi:hypothetical protein